MTLRNDGALLLPLALPIALLEERFGTSVDFLWRKVFLMRCQKPDVSERVFQRAATVAIELVLHGLYDLRTCCDRLGKKFVYILDMDCGGLAHKGEYTTCRECFLGDCEPR